MIRNTFGFILIFATTRALSVCSSQPISPSNLVMAVNQSFVGHMVAWTTELRKVLFSEAQKESFGHLETPISWSFHANICYILYRLI